MRVAFFPPPSSPLFTSQSERGGELFSTLALDIAHIIAKYDAAWKHQEYCPLADFYDPEFDDGHLPVSGSKIYCQLEHCPHDGHPSIALVQLNQHWRQLLLTPSLWSKIRLVVDMDFRRVSSPYKLRVLNMPEYAICARASGTLGLQLSIGCDPKQRQDLARGVTPTKHNLKLDVHGAVSRLKSLCFDASIGRLVTALGLLDTNTLTRIYMANGAPDRFPTNLMRLRDSRMFQSPGLKEVYCSLPCQGALHGPLVFPTGSQTFTTLDLSGAGDYHLSAVEFILHLCKQLKDLRISASADSTATLETFLNASTIIDGNTVPSNPDKPIKLRLQSFRLIHRINPMHRQITDTPFLSIFSFPCLEHLVVLHTDTVHPTDVDWLCQTAFPRLTSLQLIPEAIKVPIVRLILQRLPALQQLAFAFDPHVTSQPGWGAAAPESFQNDTFLLVLRTARMQGLKVLRLGGDCWFSTDGLGQLLEVYDGSQYSLEELSLDRWYGPARAHVVDELRMGIQRVKFRCRYISECNYASANGNRPEGSGGRSATLFECQGCGSSHPLIKLDSAPVAGWRVQDRMRRYWSAN